MTIQQAAQRAELMDAMKNSAEVRQMQVGLRHIVAESKAPRLDTSTEQMYTDCPGRRWSSLASKAKCWEELLGGNNLTTGHFDEL